MPAPTVLKLKLKSLLAQARNEGWAEWVRSEADERAVLNGCRFNAGRGQLMVDFFPAFLRHSKGRFAGQPFELLEWQRQQLIMPLFGWERRNELGRWVRRYTKAYCELPKKNGKSTIAAGVGLGTLTIDGEEGAEIYSAATDKNQASIVHGEAVTMVEKSPLLSDLLKINRSTKCISFSDTNSVYRALSASPRSNEGWNAHCIIADELHKWYGRQLFDALQWAFAAREQPLFFMITTAGDDTQSVCYEQHEYAKGVLNGSIYDDSFFPLIFAAEKDDDVHDEQTWFKANPSLGITITLKSFRDDYEKAKRSPAAFDAWKRLRLNIWSTGEAVWLKYSDWKACKDEFDERELAGRECWGGLDLAKTRDTTSLQLLFPWDNQQRLLSFFWLPEETAEELKDRISWPAWAEAGYVRLTPGNVCDYGIVFEDIAALAQRFRVRGLLYDPYNAEMLTQKIEAELEIPRIAFGQTIKNFAGPTAEFERLVMSNVIRHRGNPVMDWQIGHCKVYTDANANKRPVKPKLGDIRKIDGVVAAVMAEAGLCAPGEDTATAYDGPAEERVLFL